MTKLASVVLSGLALVITVAPALADSIVFAAFKQSTSAQDFVLTSTLLSSTSNTYSVNIAGSGQISFRYLIGGTPFSLDSTPATLSFTATSIVSGHCPSPTPNCLAVNAPFTEAGFSGSFAITLPVAEFGGSNLLSGTFNLLSPGATGAQLTSAISSPSASLEANQLVFTSDFLNFVNTVNRDATFSLSRLLSLVPTRNVPSLPVLFGFGAITNNATDNRFPNNFTAMGSGLFAEALAPEPSTFGLLAGALVGLCLWQRRRRLSRR
jgi:hypothetical protein